MPGPDDPPASPARSSPAQSSPRLHVVTGKGGVGKTTVAAALALALCQGGRRVLLCEVEGRSGIARLFDTDSLPYETRLVRFEGGEVLALAVDPGAALEEYLRAYLHLGPATGVLDRVGALDFVTTVAPGLRDVVLGGKVFEATRRRQPAGRGSHRGHRGGYVYDAVVMDAPPTGRIARFLGAAGEVAALARRGPVHGHAESIMAMFRSPVTAVHVVSLAEEMPVQETVDGVADLRAAGIEVADVVLNARRRSTLGPAEGAVLRGAGAFDLLVGALAASGSGDDGTDLPRLAAALTVEGTRQLERTDLEDRLVEDLRALDLPVVELPWLPEGIDPGSLRVLAAQLTPVVAR